MLTFNTGKSVFSAINAIAATSSRIEKDALIKAAGQSSTLFMKTVTAAYDPFKNYGISNAPTKTAGAAPGGNSLEEAFVWTTLDDLANRKLTGGSARSKVQSMVDMLDEPSSEIFRRIINKDMRAGFGDGSINRSFKGALPEFPYMRCSLPAKSNMPKWDWSTGIIVQEKADGMFANVNFDSGKFLWITSRQGSPFPADCLGIESDMRVVLDTGTQTHGELTVFENGVLCPRQIGNGILNSLLSGGALEENQKVVFYAWDQIPLGEVVPKGKFRIGYKARLSRLAAQCMFAKVNSVTSVKLIPTHVVRAKAEAYVIYRSLLAKGREGVVCKHPDAIWADNTSKDQVKLKVEFRVELRIKGFLPGSPGTKTESTFGSLLCESECGLLRVGVSGITDALRLEIHNNRDKWLDSINSVKANDIMAPEDDEPDALYSLFLPRFDEARHDKRFADTLEQIRDQREAAMAAA